MPDRLAERLSSERNVIARRWLERLQQSAVETDDVSPPQRLIDHAPHVIAEIAAHLRRPSEESRAALIARARQLSELRHLHRASVGRLQQDYRILADLLEEVVAAEVAASEQPDARAVVERMRRLGEAIRLLEHQMVDTFVGNYTQLLERQTAQLRQFSRLVSHEIRQPLAVLQVITRAFPVKTGDADSARMMDIFDRSVLRLADVTGKLERQARITPATDLAPSERVVDLTDVAHTAAAQLADAAAVAGVDVLVDPPLPVLRIDLARAELIFANLIANGIRFADPQKTTRYVEVQASGDGEPSVIITDNGVGMPPARLQTVFREFVRAHAQREAEVHAWGLGLGLTLVRECMDRSNGWVRVDSIPGRGTTFKLTWPAQALVTSAVR
jgi:signal transduction histidine kinase